MVYLVPSAVVQRGIYDIIRNNAVKAKHTILKQEPCTIMLQLNGIIIIIIIFFKLHIIQSILQQQLYTSLMLGSAQLASLLIPLKTKYVNNYREKYKSRIEIMI